MRIKYISATADQSKYLDQHLSHDALLFLPENKNPINGKSAAAIYAEGERIKIKKQISPIEKNNMGEIFLYKKSDRI